MSDPKQASTPVLFLSGAGLPAWIWDEVIQSFPQDAAAVGRYPREGDRSLAGYADAIAAQVPWTKFAVVAHSVGGVVAAELLARHPQRILGILGIAAMVPASGLSMVGAMPLRERLIIGGIVRLAGTKPPDSAIRQELASGLPPIVGDRLVHDFDPESKQLYLDQSSPHEPAVAAAYLATTRDRAVSAKVQHRAAEVLNAQWTETLDTGHLPMIEEPAAVTAAIQRFIGDISASNQ